MANDKSERKKTLVKKLAIAIILVILAVLGVDIENIIPNETNEIQNVQTEVETNVQESGEVLEVHMIDVGQGDAFLLIQDGEAALIDAGEVEEGKTVVDYIKNLGITRLKYVNVTHPHSDHNGGMTEVITNLETGTIIMPDLKDYKSTKIWYKKFNNELYNGTHEVEIAKVGNIYNLGDATIKVLGPINEPEDEPNNYSTILKVSYGNMDIIFTGDAEKKVEEDVLAAGADLDAEILKVGHHGSNTSTHEEFLDAVDPEYALIPTGNKYGHPTKSTMENLEERGIEVYRTDENGTVVVTITHDDISFNCEPGSYLSGDEVNK